MKIRLLAIGLALAALWAPLAAEAQPAEKVHRIGIPLTGTGETNIDRMKRLASPLDVVA